MNNIKSDETSVTLLTSQESEIYIDADVIIAEAEQKLSFYANSKIVDFIYVKKSNKGENINEN